MESAVTNQDPDHPSSASDNRVVTSHDREGDISDTLVRPISTLEDSPCVVTEFSTLDLFKEAVEESVMRVANLVTEKLEVMEKNILQEINGTRGNVKKKDKVLAPPSPNPNSGSEDAEAAVRRGLFDQIRSTCISTNSRASNASMRKSNVLATPSPSPNSGSEDVTPAVRRGLLDPGRGSCVSTTSRSSMGITSMRKSNALLEPGRSSCLSANSRASMNNTSMRKSNAPAPLSPSPNLLDPGRGSCLSISGSSSMNSVPGEVNHTFTSTSTYEQGTDQSAVACRHEDGGTRDSHVQQKAAGKSDMQKKAKGKYLHRSSTGMSIGSPSVHAPPSLLSLEKALDNALIEGCRLKRGASRQSTMHARLPEPERVSAVTDAVAEHRVPNERNQSQQAGGRDTVADVHQSLADRATLASSSPAFLPDISESRGDHNSSRSGFFWRMIPSIRVITGGRGSARTSASSSWSRSASERNIVPNSSASMRALSHHRSDQLVQKAMDMTKSVSVDEVPDDDDMFTYLDFFSVSWLCISGIVNWSDNESNNSTFVRTLNRSVMLLLMLGILLFCTYEIASVRSGALEETCDMIMCMEHFLAPVAVLGLGCFLRLASLFYYHDHVLGHLDSVLTIYLQSVGVLDAWNSSSRRDMLKICALWLCWMGLCIYTSLGWKLHVARTSLHLAVIAVSTNVFCAFVFHMMQVCNGFFFLLDSFCMTIVNEESCEEAAKRWNTLMAIQKRVCFTVARTYILLLTSAIAALMFPISIGSHFVAGLPGAFAILLMLWVSFSISGVTSRCDRVPAFINTLDFNGDNFDYQRQYVVDYIIHSRAGFYMFDVRVTAETVVKTAYVGSVIAVAFASNRANI